MSEVRRRFITITAVRQPLIPGSTTAIFHSLWENTGIKKALLILRQGWVHLWQVWQGACKGRVMTHIWAPARHCHVTCLNCMFSIHYNAPELKSLDSTALLIPPEPCEKGIKKTCRTLRVSTVGKQDCALYIWPDLTSFIHLRGFKAVLLLLSGRIPNSQLAFLCPKKAYHGKNPDFIEKITFLRSNHKSDYFASLLLNYHNIPCSLPYLFQWQKDQMVGFHLVFIHVSLFNIIISCIKALISLQQKSKHIKSY